MRKGAVMFDGVGKIIRLPVPVWLIVGNPKLKLSTAHDLQLGSLLEIRYCFLKGGLWDRRPWWHRTRWLIRGPRELRRMEEG